MSIKKGVKNIGKGVGIVGAGVVSFKTKWYEKTYYELAQMATPEAIKDAITL